MTDEFTESIEQLYTALVELEQAMATLRAALVAHDDTPAPVLHCWADELSQYETGSPEWEAVMQRGNATCLLLDGHEGPHEFILDSEIMVEFVYEEMEETDDLDN